MIPNSFFQCIGMIRPLRRLFAYAYSKWGSPIFKVNVHGMTMFFPKDNVALALTMASGFYEPMTTQVFRALVRPGFTVVDIGAGFGYYTLLASKLVGSDGHVYAFEPEPIRYVFLTKNIQFNLLNNVTAVNKVVLDSSRKVSFFVRGETSSISPYLAYERQITVEATSLDEYFENGKRINLIKMDAEGSEYRILLGMETLLRSNQDLVLITEFAPNLIEILGDDPRDFIKTLTTYFKVFIIDELNFEVKLVNENELIAKVKEDREKCYSTNLLCIKRINKNMI